VSKVPAKNSSIIRSDENYKGLLNELRSILEKGQNRAYKAVDNIKVQTYWQIGERIVREEIRNKERAEYGKQLVVHLSLDLQVNKRELYRIIKFFRSYEIVATVSPQLSWNHYKELIDIENDNKRMFFQKKAIEMSWSVRELRNQIKNDASENRAINETLKPATTKLSYSNPVELFKSEYDLGFAGNYVDEKQLEGNIVKNIDDFLKELGTEISYLGRQVPIRIDGTTHFVDLVLYHKGIPCNILIELKTGKFDGRDVGQMNKYVNYFRSTPNFW
jgi:predicted nuclease of restriction endonuclease-like (RecB) superfamily